MLCEPEKGLDELSNKKEKIVGNIPLGVALLAT